MEFVKTSEDKKALKYAKKLPENREVAKEILDIMENHKTEIVIDKDIKSSYYVFLNNKIYIADSKENNNLYSRFVLIAHECVHSMQSKVMQVLNFAFSNIEIVAFILMIIFKIFKIGNFKYLMAGYIAVALISIILRLILEVHAVVNSVPLARKYLNTKLSAPQADTIINSSSKYIKKYMPLFILSLCYKKLIKIAIVLILYFVF